MVEFEFSEDDIAYLSTVPGTVSRALLIIFTMTV